MTTQFDRLKELSATDFAQELVFTEEGHEQSICTICSKKDDCDDACYINIITYLESEVISEQI